MYSKSFTCRAAALAAAATLGSGAAAGAAQANVVRGTVVHRNARARSFVVASTSGRLFAIHAGKGPSIASEVAVSVRRLRNGTYAALATHVVSSHRSARVRLHGVVTYVDRKNGTYTLSAGGVSMLVRTRSGHAAAVADALPGVGTVVTATGAVDDNGDLYQSAVQTDGTESTGIYLEGTVLAVDSSAGTITISSDDDDQAAGSIVVTVPSTLNISLFTVGEEVELQVTLAPDGTYVLVGSASDQGAQGANSQGSEQGDQGDQGAQGENQDTGASSTSSDSQDQSGSGEGDASGGASSTGSDS